MALRAIWEFMDRDVTHKILYGLKRSWAEVHDYNCIILTGPDQYNVFFRILFELDFDLRITKNISSDRFASIEYNITNSSWHFGPNGSDHNAPINKCMMCSYLLCIICVNKCFKNISWYIPYLTNSSWQFMNRDVTH
jgi:hypothetical protein